MTALVKLVSTLLGGLLLCLIIYFFLLNPALSQLSIFSDTLRQKNVELATLQQQITAYKNAQTDLAQAVQKDQIFEAFLSREELVAAVKNLESAAVVTRTVETLKITEPEADSNSKPKKVVESVDSLKEIPYRVSTLNDYVGTIQFLMYLEHLPQFTEISKITLSAETVDSDTAAGRVYTGKIFGSLDGVFFVKSQTQ